jgi:hypothetical protein
MASTTGDLPLGGRKRPVRQPDHQTKSGKAKPASTAGKRPRHPERRRPFETRAL